MDVICPGCRKSYHETTDNYDPDKPANGSMVRLKNPWRGWGWCTFGDGMDGRPPSIAEQPGTYWSMMDCPGCGAPMAPSGNLIVGGGEDIPDPPYTCEKCGKEYKLPMHYHHYEKHVAECEG